jgi:hypothetical protein
VSSGSNGSSQVSRDYRMGGQATIQQKIILCDLVVNHAFSFLLQH